MVKRREEKEVKRSYGIAQLLYNLRKRRDARVDFLRLIIEAEKKEMRMAKRKEAVNKLLDTDPSEWTGLTCSQKLEKSIIENMDMLELGDENFRETDLTLAQVALQHYNENNGCNYQLVQLAGTFSRFSSSTGRLCYHTNFLASCTTADSVDVSPKLFFAEVFGLIGNLPEPISPTVSCCTILFHESPLFRGCGICPRPIGHPESGYRVGYGVKRRASDSVQSQFAALRLS